MRLEAERVSLCSVRPEYELETRTELVMDYRTHDSEHLALSVLGRSGQCGWPRSARPISLLRRRSGPLRRAAAPSARIIAGHSRVVRSFASIPRQCTCGGRRERPAEGRKSGGLLRAGPGCLGAQTRHGQVVPDPVMERDVLATNVTS